MAGTSIFDGGNPIALPYGWLALFLLQLILVMVFCRLLAIPLKWLKQPRVISEVLVGILLGPSAFGYIPNFTATVFPPASLPLLAIVANLGLIFFLFLVGMELDPSVLRQHAKKAVFTSIGGIVVPFGLGAAVSWLLYNTYMLEPQVTPTGVVKPAPSFGAFLAFVGVAMSITAFPVLARIMTERNLLQTPVGTATIAAAAVDDVVAWTLLAIVVSVLNATSMLTALYIFLVSVAWALMCIFAIRPLLRKMVLYTESSEAVNSPLSRVIPVSELSIFVMFVFLFISSFITEIIGIHAIFGAFLAGLVTPHDHGFAHKLTEKIEDLVTLVFIPLYFTASGLRTQIGLLNDWQSWGFVVLVTVVACAGKIIGCTSASRLSGMPWRESWAVGILMNTKGLVEIIVLNIGLDAGVINTKIFTIMVLMAIITTLLTSPLIAWVYPPKYAFAENTQPIDEESQTKQSEHVDSASGLLLETSDMIVPVGQGHVDGLLVVAKLMSQPAHYATSGSNQLLTQSRGPKIHLLRLFEMDDRLSSIGLASAAAFSHVSTQSNLSIISVSKPDDVMLEANMDYAVTYAARPSWPEELVARGVQKKAGWLLVSYPRLDDVSDAFANQVLAVTAKGGVGEGVMAVIAIVDRGLTDSATYNDLFLTSDISKLRNNTRRKLVLLFHGGVDDRAALALLARCVNDLSTSVYLVMLQPADRLDSKDLLAVEPLKADPAVTLFSSTIEDAIQNLNPTGRDLIIIGREATEGLGARGQLVGLNQASLAIVQGRLGLD